MAKRFVVLGCVFLVVVFAGLEAMHAHADGKLAAGSGPCAICVTVHANAPAATFHSLPTLRALEMVAVSFLAQGKSTSQELSLFIRPPPSLL